MLQKTPSRLQEWFKKRNRTIAGCVAILIFCALMLVVIYYTLDSSGSSVCEICPKASFTFRSISLERRNNLCEAKPEGSCNLVCENLSDDKIQEKIIEGSGTMNCAEISIQLFFTNFPHQLIPSNWLRNLKPKVRKLEFIKSPFERVEVGAFATPPFEQLETLLISDGRLKHLTKSFFAGMESLRSFAISFENRDTHNDFKVDGGVFAETNLHNLTIHKLLKSQEEVSNLLQQAKTLKIIDLSSNSLQEISESTFHNLGTGQTLNLSDNRLTKIHVDTFKHLKVDTLDLSKNLLRTLDKGTFDPNAEYPKEIFADGNAWICECPLYWFKEFASMHNSPVSHERPPLCNNETPFDQFQWDPACSPTTTTTTTTTTEKPTTTTTTTTEEPTTTTTTTTEEPTTTTTTTTEEPTTTTTTTTTEEPITTTTTSTEELTTSTTTTTQEPTTTATTTTTTKEPTTTTTTTTEKPQTTTVKPSSTTSSNTTVSTSSTTTGTDPPNSSPVVPTTVSDLPSTPEELQNLTTMAVVATPEPEFESVVRCKDGRKKPSLLPLEAEKVFVDEISVLVRNQTVKFSFNDFEDYPVMEISLFGDFKSFNLFYYESLGGEVNCVWNLQEKIYLEDLERETFYTFCLHHGGENTVAVRGCFGVKTPAIWENRSWLENGTKAAVISTFIITIFLCVFATGVTVFFCIRQHPNLIKGNKRVIIIGNKTTEAVILPKDLERTFSSKSILGKGQGTSPPPMELLHDPSYITPIYEKLKFRPSFRDRRLSDSSVSSYIQSLKNTKDCLGEQRAQPDIFLTDGYEVSHLPPPLPPCHPTQEHIYEDNIYFNPQC